MSPQAAGRPTVAEPREVALETCSTRCRRERSSAPCRARCGGSRTTRAASRREAASSRSAAFAPTGAASFPRPSSGAPGRSSRSLPIPCPEKRSGGSWCRTPDAPCRGWRAPTTAIPRAASPSWGSRARTGRPRPRTSARPSSGLGASRPASSGRSSTSSEARRGTPARPPPRRSSSRGSSPRWWRPGSAAWRWRCPPTRSSFTGWTAWPSTWPCSRT